MRTCSFIKKDKQKCRANPIAGSEFCFSHDPGMAERKRLAVKKGGTTIRKNTTSLSSIEVNNVNDVVRLLTTMINEVRLGDAEIRVANCIGYLSGHLIRAIEISSLENRVAQIERTIIKS
jgi:hypothetical protein